MSDAYLPEVRIGGVFRCCLDQPKWPATPKEGDVLPCPHGCGDGLRYRDEAWEAKWIGDQKETP